MAEKAFYQSLPTKRMAAGCLFFNDNGEVLLVKPTYKESWEIPGGVTEDNESPKQCCEREVLEEIGIVVELKRLLVIDYNSYPQDKHKTESLMFIFDGGTLSAQDIAAIILKEDELSDWLFFGQNHLPEQLGHSLRNRILQAIKQKAARGAIYLENQHDV